MKRNLPSHRPNITITPEGWIYLVILGFISIGAVLRNVNLLMLMAGMMTAPLLINWRLSVLRSRTLTAKRSLPYRAHARSLANLQWIVFNQSSLIAWGLEIRDTMRLLLLADETERAVPTPSLNHSEPLILSSSEARFVKRLKELIWGNLSPGPTAAVLQSIRLHLPTVGGRQQQVVSGRIYVTHRGRYQFGPAEIATRFPFGLILAQIEIESTEDLYVAPAVGQLTPVWERRIRSALAGNDALQKRRGISGDDFYALRRWRSGDSQKLIHWRTSAKYGYPIVKQFEQPEHRDFALILDLYVPPVAGAERESAEQLCETILSFATTVLLNLGSAVQGRIAIAICGAETLVLESRSFREILELAMRNMAVVQPGENPQIETSLMKAAESVSPQTPLFVISTRAPIFLAPSGEASDTASATQLRLLDLWPSVDWISAQSQEFQEMFSPLSDDSDLRGLTEKWSLNVPD